VLAAVPGREDEALEAFRARGLAAAVCGSFDATRVLRIASGGAVADVWDLWAEPLTALGG
jgi:selenophosphate synthetase-related protein